MDILITGAAGFVGRNLTAALEAIRDGKDRTQPGLSVGRLYLCDLDTPAEVLEEGCRKADFVLHLAGVNRPRDPEEFRRGNVDFTEHLLALLERFGNTCPVMLASSIQATCIGRYDSPYGRSKRDGEQLLFDYSRRTGAPVLVYRFANLFGKWCRPNYNSVIATFCHKIARDEPITVSDPKAQLELVYIDDLVQELLQALQGKPCRCEFDGLQPILRADGRYCTVSTSHRVTLEQIVGLLERFRDQPRTLLLPEQPAGSFEKKLYATYLSYLPPEKVRFPLRKNEDARGSFTELLRTEKCGQFSVNISRPGVTKGQHWHHTKWEFFIVVSGEGLIRQRRLGSEEILEFRVSGERPEAVHMLPGYTHNIINLSETRELVTLMWASECFDPEKPDTFYEVVQ